MNYGESCQWHDEGRDELKARALAWKLARRVSVLLLGLVLFFAGGTVQDISLSSAWAATSTTSKLTVSPSPAQSGQSVVLTATVTGSSNPSGTVTFKDGSTTLGTGTLSSGKATFTTTTLAVGSHSLTVVYAGNSTNSASTSSAVSLTVNKATTTTALTAGPSPASVGQSVTLTATITGNGPTGTVTFKDGSTTLGTGTISAGKATLSTSALSIATHSLTAVYAGDSKNLTSTSSTTSLTVSKATTTTTVAATPNPSVIGQSVTITATVTGSSPSGTVTFKDGTSTLGTGTLSSGKATLSTAALAIGTHSLTAVYAGDTNNLTSTSAASSLTVNKVTTTSTVAATPSPASFGQSVTLTATITGSSPTGTVTFKDGTTTLGTGTISAGKATLSNAALAVGVHSLTVVYAGDTNNATSTSGATSLTINTVTSATVLTVSPNPATSGQSATLTATITGSSPTGTVTFKDGTTTLGTGTISAGKATFVTSTLAVGTHSLTAVYAGDTNNAASTSTAASLTITAETSTATLAVAPNPSTLGQSVALTATIAGSSPTGTVTFKDGATTLGTGTLSGGVATLSTATLAVGTHSLSIVYAGDSNNAASTSAANSLTVNTAATTGALVATPNPASLGQNITLTATITGSSPTGTVTFKDGATTLGTATLSSGTAILSTTTLAMGTHTLTADYGGDSNNAATLSPSVTLQVNAITTSTSISATPNPADAGQNITIAASVIGNSPSGTVTFKDGSTALGSLTLVAGNASFSINTLAVGGHTLTVEYPGDSNNADSISSPLLLNVSTPIIRTGQYLYEYDPMGNLTRQTNPLGAPTEQQFDTLGRPYQTNLANPASAGVDTVHPVATTYDGQGRVKSVTDPRGLITSYTTDGLGNVLQQLSSDTGTTGNLQYDQAGNLIQKTDARGKTTLYTYDALNRPSSILYGDETVGFTYDEGVNGKGRLTTLTDASGSTHWNYDATGRVADRIQSSTITLASHTTYDSFGRVQTFTYPSGRVISYGYNAAGQIQEIRVNGQIVMTNISYAPFGGVQSWAWGNAQSYARTYDANGRMTSFTLGDATRSLDWDAASRLRNVQETGTTTSTIASSGYDNQDRLISHSTLTSSYGYGYDLNGNRASFSVGGSVFSYTTDSVSNRLMFTSGPVPAKSYLYDAAGNPSTDSQRNYVWSNNGRLKSVTVSGTTTSYAYNGFGQRVSKQQGAAIIATYAYDEVGHVIGEYDGAGNPIEEHVWLGDTPAVMLAGAAATSSTYYVFADQIDTPKALTDSTGKVVWKWDGEGFGATLPNEDPDADSAKVTYNLRFPGQIYDKESSLFYNNARYYDPTTGRYISSDPIGLDGGSLSTYLYANASPMLFTDVSGLEAAMCTRMLQVPIPGARHCYVQFNGNSSDTMSFDPKGVHKDPGPWPGSCTKAEGDDNDDCVRREMQKCQAEDYSFTEFNCCHCVQAALEACGLTIPNKSWPNWPINPAPKGEAKPTPKPPKPKGKK